jgi:hypothetical protein
MPTAKEELEIYSIMTECRALHKYKSQRELSKFDLARYYMLKYIIKCALKDPVCGDYSDKENTELMKEAGRLLNEDGGLSSMHDGLVWSFVPRRYHREIDLMWDNIGEWKA